MKLKSREIQKILYHIVIFNSSMYGQTPLCISLGSACASALNLRDLKLRLEAYPFDWTISPLESVHKALSDDFQFFLTAIKIRPDNQGIIDYYGFHFTHDLPTTNQPHIDPFNTDSIGNNSLAQKWENALPAVREKYSRRIERFRNACLGNKKVFFFRSETTQDEAILLRDFFKNSYPELDFIIIAVANNPIFKQPWNLENIINFYSSVWYDPVGWAIELKKIPEFNDLHIPRNILVFAKIESLFPKDLPLQVSGPINSKLIGS